MSNTPDDLNLRAAPHVGHNVIAHLANGTHVEAEGQSMNGFEQVKNLSTGQVGWASSRYLTADDHVEIRRALPVDPAHTDPTPATHDTKPVAHDDAKAKTPGPVDPKQKLDVPDYSNLPVQQNPDDAHNTHSVSGHLFVTQKGDVCDIDPKDVKQGELGDCYFLSSLAAVARANPEIIRKLIHQVDAHTYAVSLYKSEGLHRTLHTVRVTDDLCEGNGASDTCYAHPAGKDKDGAELWVSLFEKAYATLNGSYKAIRGGWGKKGLETLLVGGADYFIVRDHNADDCLHRLDAALRNHQACTSGSQGIPLDSQDREILGPGDAERKELAKQYNAILGHEYAVKSVDVAARTVSLQNPWGIKHLDNLPVDVWRQLFYAFSIGRA